MPRPRRPKGPRGKPDLVAFCDGACEPINPGGTATWGFVIYDGHGAEVARGQGVVGAGPAMSNNVAEYAAVVAALDQILSAPPPPGSLVSLRGDSRLWVQQLRGEWRVLGGLYVETYRRALARLEEVRRRGVAVDFAWVPRAENGVADELSKAALAGAGVAVRTH
jgi:ribonuclease HI